MADLLYGCVTVERKQRQFQHIGFTINGFTNEELRAFYYMPTELFF